MWPTRGRMVIWGLDGLDESALEVIRNRRSCRRDAFSAELGLGKGPQTEGEIDGLMDEVWDPSLLVHAGATAQR